MFNLGALQYAVFGQWKENKCYAIYYANQNLDEVQVNDVTME